MSQECVSQKIKRTCDACGTEREWELIGPSENTLREMENWYTVIREVVVGDRFQKLLAQACSLACVPVAAVKLALPPAPPEAPEIDLASLRTGGNQVN